MVITVLGVFVFAIGFAILFWGRATAMLAFVFASTLFGAAATLELPALGGSTVWPAMVATLFLVAHTVGRREFRLLADSPVENRYLVIFALYAAITAFVLPRVFEATMPVVPMRPGINSFETVPLTFSNQNITHALNI